MKMLIFSRIFLRNVEIIILRVFIIPKRRIDRLMKDFLYKENRFIMVKWGREKQNGL